MTKPLKPQPADVLPPEARDLLIRASQVKDPQERRVAIDAAIDYLKIRFPKLFQPIPTYKD